MDNATQERLKDLRKQSREINKQIKATQSTAKMDKALADWQSLQELKDKLEEQVQSHPLGSNKTLKWLMKQPDYYTYALWTQSYTYKANSKDAAWVQEELKRGTKESTLIDNANKMRIKAWQRQETARRRKRKTASTGNLHDDFGSTKSNKLTSSKSQTIKTQGVG